MKTPVKHVLNFAVAVALGACAGAAPRELILHEDQCNYCRMEITDARFGTQVITNTGKIHVFDAVECMVGYLNGSEESTVRSTWVANLEKPSEWIVAAEAGYLIDSEVRSPMGRLAAFASPEAATVAQRTLGGHTVSWNAVRSDSAGILTHGGHGSGDDHSGHMDMVKSESSEHKTIASAVAAASPGDVIRIAAGIYKEPTVIVDVPGVTIVGENWPVLDGEGVRELMVISADDVTVRGLAFRNTGVSHMQDRSALRAAGVSNCLIEENRFRDALFAIYLQKTEGCTVRGNDIVGDGSGESVNGNGVHLWYSSHTTVAQNRISGQRDGIYFEFSKHSTAIANVSEDNRRYGLHFMFSDSSHYTRNTFRRNAAGTAVMYSRTVEMRENKFLDATGTAAYGLLLKDISDAYLVDNTIRGNSTGLFVEGSSRMAITGNVFEGNGWGVRLMADAVDNHFTGNSFLGNSFDVATNSRTLNSTFEGNWWDAYRGYDLDRDGAGDVPFHPVRLFALVVEKHPASILLLRSPVTAVLDAAERVFPVLTPAVADASPLMRRSK